VHRRGKPAELQGKRSTERVFEIGWQRANPPW
jgi:hypothetical protein